ncbi:DUF397 domain-containing protein [Streptomyces sp. NPDC058284]|uniref:DUF397 domain-containing protein n=1 Tax=unclassified Streptomyces TaxID=2593676 RepID=UPI003651DB3B
MAESKWQRSSFCGGGGNNCVEVAATGTDRIALRESDSPTQVLASDRAALEALMRSVKHRGHAATP